MKIPEKLLNDNVILGRKYVTPIPTHTESAWAATFKVERLQLPIRCDQQSTRSSVVTVNCIIVVKQLISLFSNISADETPNKNISTSHFTPLH